LSTPAAFASYPSATAVGSVADNIGAASAGATEETPTVAMTMPQFSMKARRERLMHLSSLTVRVKIPGREVEDASGSFLGYS